MKCLFIIPLILFTFSACEKNEAVEEELDWTEYNAPCDQAINHIVLNEDTFEVDKILFYQDYYYTIRIEIKGSNEYLSLFFSNLPQSGIYKTTTRRDGLKKDLKDCIGELGGNSINIDNDIYITNYGNGFIQISFCEVPHGNWTVKKMSANIIFQKR